MLARDTEIVKAAKEAVVKFKDSEKFVALLEKKYEAGRDTGYDAEVKDIFYNIWLKYQDIDYRFLGGEFVKLMHQWLENERLGTLNDALPPSTLAPVTEGNIIASEVGPSKVSEQQPPVDVEEGEVVASNPPPTINEPTNEVISGFMGNHDLINLEEEEEPSTIVDNNPPAYGLQCVHYFAFFFFFFFLFLLYGP